ncbi:hypothetical protein [Pseudomonas sp. BN515]|uniref:hypothetical protein n=1 Tax=Pseudomonas sp. BN515 TaxID=2567892 RepID=UPI002455E2D5|nr:hypothetical protein [Pseudomonas sp. BN515]MDH4873689.1 hypothetical protein [Pseudomonas sp. BN515]
MISRLVAWLYVGRGAILVFMVASSLVNAISLLGNWDIFLGVLLGHFWFGQCFYSFVSGREIFFSAGASVEKDANVYIRMAVGSFALFVFVVLFFFRGY